jgi:hypothetical protein
MANLSAWHVLQERLCVPPPIDGAADARVGGRFDAVPAPAGRAG